jgi:hypothetical protein
LRFSLAFFVATPLLPAASVAVPLSVNATAFRRRSPLRALRFSLTFSFVFGPAPHVPVPLASVAGLKKLVPRDHTWLETARLVETCLGDDLDN